MRHMRSGGPDPSPATQERCGCESCGQRVCVSPPLWVRWCVPLLFLSSSAASESSLCSSSRGGARKALQPKKRHGCMKGGKRQCRPALLIVPSGCSNPSTTSPDHPVIMAP